jgi:AcrR family transcriptional regulator
MARTLDPVAHAVRREAVLDAGQRVIATMGYAQLSIQDVIAELSSSKGAFYHYFDSKAALLDGVVSRMVEAATAYLAPAVADPGRSAPEKLNAVFSGLADFKAERKDLLLALTRVWLSDDNAVVREHFRRGVVATMTPLLATIIRQGVAEGAFTTASPDHAARVYVSLILGANEAATDLFVAHQDGAVTFEEVEQTLEAFAEAFERILGIRPGSLELANRSAVLREWFVEATPAEQGSSA